MPSTSIVLAVMAAVVLMVAVTDAFSPVHQRRPSQSATTTTTALNVAVDTSEIKNGMTLELDDGEPYKVMSFSIMKQARGAAKTTIKFKNLMRGNTIENTYRSGEKFESALIEKKDHQFTYKEGDNYFFMNSETFEEVAVGGKVVDEVACWLEEGSEASLVFFKGNVIEVQVPTTGVYEIVETEPSMKGNTAQGHTKPAVLSCGATVTVPGYLEQGEMIKVDTSKFLFLERANK